MSYWAGMGTIIKMGATTITQATSITPPALEMGNVETTHLTSSARENLATIIDPGTASFNIEYDPAVASHAALYAAFLAKTVAAWDVVIADGDATVTIEFNAHIETFGIEELTVDSVTVIPVTLRISGLPTITYDDGVA